MRRGILIVFLVAMTLGCAALAQQPNGSRYIVELNDEAVATAPDAASLARELAATYGGTIESTRGPGVFVMITLPARARLLRSDRRVRQVAEAPKTLKPAPLGNGSMSWTLTYDGAGNISAMGNDVYRYDSAGRLLTATVDNPNNTMSYTYDSFGNRTSATGGANAAKCVGGTDCDKPITVNPATNHLTGSGSPCVDDAGNVVGQGVCYDAAGNLNRLDAGTTFTYDAMSMVSSDSVANAQYIYTADNERIAVYGLGTWTWTLRDLANHPLREFTSSDTATTWGTANLTWTRDYVWRGNALLASEARTSPADPTIVTEHFHLDHLGTPRLVTNGSGGKVGVHSYYPFGGEIDLNPFEAPESELKFTSHARDTGRGGGLSLDYMHARSYTATIGRFLSVDSGEAEFERPQTWNRYSYALDTPLVYVDPDGRSVVINGDTEEERRKALEALKHSLHDTFAASRLMMVKVGDHFEAKVAGSLDEFKGGSDTAFTVGTAIGLSAKIGIGFGAVDPSNHGASTNQVAGTHDSNITVDPNAFPQILGGLYQTVDSAIQHEFGHALGYATMGLDDLKVAALWGLGTNEQALYSENLARAWYVKQIEMTYGKNSVAARAARRIYKPRLTHGVE